MPLFVLQTNEALAVVALVSAGSALLFVVGVYLDLEHLVAVPALLRPHLAVVFMITEGRLLG